MKKFIGSGFICEEIPKLGNIQVEIGNKSVEIDRCFPIELTSVEVVGTTVTIHLPLRISVPIQTNLQMRPIFYEAPDDLIMDELA